MTKYALYVESGPRRRKTMVHVLDMLGCIAQGPTTEDALEATPEAIRAYLRFLKRHGEAVKTADAITTVVAAHVMEGTWIGNGDPTPGFAPDFQPLRPADLKTYLRRFGWMRGDLVALIRDVPREQLIAEPAAGRSLYRILEHIAGAQGGYLRYLVGKVDGLSEAIKAVNQGPETLPAALTHLGQITSARLERLSAAERKQPVQHGQVTWTARRALRRILEHEWEHLQEISTRMSRDAGPRAAS